jgi:hypothetical protein
MRTPIGVCLLALLLGAASGCERLGNEGEGCSSPGVSESDYATSERGADCATGLICAPDRASTPEYSAFATASCREICASSADCADGYTCRGVTGAEYRQACLPVAAD